MLNMLSSHKNPDLLNLLLETKTAKLVEHKRGKPSDVYEELMLIRDELAKQSKKN